MAPTLIGFGSKSFNACEKGSKDFQNSHSFERRGYESKFIPSKLIWSYWADRDPGGRPCLQNCHLSTAKTGQQNVVIGHFVICFGEFLWQSVPHCDERQGLSVSWVEQMCFPQVHATLTSGGRMITSDWLSAIFEQSTSSNLKITKLGARGKIYTSKILLKSLPLSMQIIGIEAVCKERRWPRRCGGGARDCRASSIADYNSSSTWHLPHRYNKIEHRTFLYIFIR